MTDFDDCSRRRLLATLGSTAAVGLAGCGYQPGGGELEWETSVVGMVGPGFGTQSDRKWFGNGTSLFSIRNRSGQVHEIGSGFVDVDDAQLTAYDSSGNRRWRTETDQQYDGEPAVDEDVIYVPLEDGAVTALELSPGRDSERRGTDQDHEHSHWTTDRTGPPLTLEAGDGLVVGRHEDGILVLEAENGEELLEHTESASDVAAGGGFAWASIDEEVQTLTGYDSDGNKVASLELPWRPNWLTTAGSTALVGSRGDGVWAVDADAGGAESEETEPAWTLEADLDSQDPVVFDETLSILAGGNLIAIDIESGDQRWELEGYSVSGPLLADGDGIYSRGTPPGETACGLFAVTASGEEWWSVPPYNDLGCSGDLHLVGDRLVVIDGRDLYGFRNDPGSRFSIL